MLQIMDIR